MNIEHFQKMLKSNISVKCHLDSIPKGAKYPAISFRHQSHSAAILLKGEKSGRSDTWALTLATKEDKDIDKLVNLIERVHNLQDENYQRVFVRVGNVIPKAPDEDITLTSVTIQTFSWR